MKKKSFYFFCSVDIRRNCVVHSKRLASANTVRNANLLTVKMNCVRFNVIQNTRPNIVAHFMVLACAHMDHVAIFSMICLVKTMVIIIIHVHVAPMEIVMKVQPHQTEMLHVNLLAAKMIPPLYKIVCRLKHMVLVVILHRPKLMQSQKQPVSWSKMIKFQLQTIHLVAVHPF